MEEGIYSFCSLLFVCTPLISMWVEMGLISEARYWTAHTVVSECHSVMAILVT